MLEWVPCAARGARARPGRPPGVEGIRKRAFLDIYGYPRTQLATTVVAPWCARRSRQCAINDDNDTISSFLLVTT